MTHTTPTPASGRRKFFPSPAVRRYQLRFGVLMGIYGVLLTGFIWLFTTNPPDGPIRYALAVLPALPIVGVVVALGFYFRDERDEFLRAFLVTAMMWAMGATLAITTVWGFLETVGAPHLNPYWVFPIFGVSMAFAQPFLWWRYR
jgi:hypothetical protein